MRACTEDPLDSPSIPAPSNPPRAAPLGDRLDWFLPGRDVHLTHGERRRIQISIAASLLLPVLGTVSMPFLLAWHGPSFVAIDAVGMGLLVVNAFAPRVLGFKQPGVVACLVSMGVLLALGMREPELTRIFVVIPVMAALLAGSRTIGLSMLVGVAALLCLKGPLTTRMSLAEAWGRVEVVLEMLTVGLLAVLSERLRVKAERERDEAQEQMLAAIRREALQEEERRAQARMLRHHALSMDIGAALAVPGPLFRCLQDCCEAIARHVGAGVVRLWLLDAAEDAVTLAGSAGPHAAHGSPAPVPVDRSGVGFIAREKRSHMTNDAPVDPRLEERDWARQHGMVAFAGYPMLIGDHPIGVLALFAPDPLPRDTLAVLGTVADTIAQAIERRRAEEALELRAEQLARSNAELARSNAELEHFAYVASHDLQEPLRAVSNYMGLLQRRYRGQLDQDAHDFIGFAVDGAKRMKALIDDLLAYSRVGTQEKPLVEVSMEEVTQRVLDTLRATAEQHGAEISVSALPEVRGDAGQLEQVLQNLVANAVKFHAPGVPPRVTITAERGDAAWRFAVKDNGIGIEPRSIDRLFILFQRLHGRDEYPGTGLGLAICKKIIERHGGRIWVESAPGKGSTFFFTLPLQEASEAA